MVVGTRGLSCDCFEQLADKTRLLETDVVGCTCGDHPDVPAQVVHAWLAARHLSLVADSLVSDPTESVLDCVREEGIVGRLLAPDGDPTELRGLLLARGLKSPTTNSAAGV